MKVFVLRTQSNADHIGAVIAVFAANDDNPPSVSTLTKLAASGYKLCAFVPGLPRSQEEWDDMLKKEVLTDQQCDLASDWHEGIVGCLTCIVCNKPINVESAHLHQGNYIGDECCWDERLKITE